MEFKLWFFFYPTEINGKYNYLYGPFSVVHNILQHNMKAILFLRTKLNPLRAIDLVSGLTYSFHFIAI